MSKSDRSTRLKKHVRPMALALAFGGVMAGMSMAFIPSPPKVGVDARDVPFYKMPWGDDKPFWPSRIQTTDGKLADPKHIPSAADCVKCHQSEFEEWAISLHANAGLDAIYDKTIDFNEHFALDGPEKIRFCEGCHEPGEVVLGRTNRVSSVMPAEAETEGLTCVFCHTAVHADPEKGNGAITYAINEAHDRLSDAFIMASPRDHARAFGAKATGALITRSEFCGACHVEHYDSSNSKANGSIPVQQTYREWKESWYAKNNITCQDCHMHPEPVKYIRELAAGRISKPKRYVHTFIGANYLLFDTSLKEALLYLRGGIPAGISARRYLELIGKQKEKVEEFLRASARLEIRALDLKPGKRGHLKVAVMNIGAGHALPTGVTDQKYMWLEVLVQDATGRKIHHSGWFDADRGNHDPNAVQWRERFLDPEGREITDHLTFNTAYVELIRPLIPARGEDVVSYDFNIPEDASGPLKVQVRLWYRVARQDLVSRVVKLNMVVPPFLMAELSTEAHTQ